ncbi:hypothetical protein EV182_000210 [Spiromyces aspiralis]|uniref:Uncharacterized protein n=1 Tax=Spiromyces aspiralis TaxID=68401 RepID=A0ACC1HWA4_9FUNG|nr:hypothetical protein EV182_000210 [Spiromyces aspiralis]
MSDLRTLNIKIGVVKRVIKDKLMYLEEEKTQRERIKQMEEQNKDEYDIKKQASHLPSWTRQYEVLEETLQMIPDAVKRLNKAVNDLKNVATALSKEDLFDRLELAIREIYQQNASKLSFEQLYGSAYKLVQNQWGNYLYSGVRRVITEEVSRIFRDRLLDSKSRAEANFSAETAQEFLKTLRSVWSNHVMSMLIVKDILIYVDRQYVRGAGELPVYEMGVNIFRDEVITSKDWGVSRLLRRIVLDQIHRERNGNEIDRGTLRSIVDMLQEMADNVQFSKKDLYQAELEPSILGATTEFYRTQARQWVESMTISRYLEETQRCIRDEESRASAYLATETSTAIQAILLQELVRAYSSEIISLQGGGLRCLLDECRTKDLLLMYTIYSKFGDTVDLLRDSVRAHVVEKGGQINALLDEAMVAKPATGQTPAARPGRISGTEKTKLACQWAHKVSDLYKQYNHIVTEAFDSSQSFRVAVDDAFSEFMDAISQSPEFLSLFIDEHLKNTRGIPETELDKSLDDSVALVKLLRSKDMFEYYYAQHLSKRLLIRKSQAVEVETSLIARLKTFSEPQFIKKLEVMFRDLTVSSELSEEFGQYLELHQQHIGFSLAPSILTNTIWPLPKQKGQLAKEGNTEEEDLTPIGPNVPPRFQRAIDVFFNFYKTRFNGRKLCVYYHMGTVDMRVHFEARDLDLVVSTYQAFILSLYGDLDEGTEHLTFEEIRARLNMPAPELARQLQSLACGKHKILIKEPMTSKQVLVTDKFKFNYKFTSKTRRVKIPMIAAAPQVETDLERQETNAKIAKERELLIDAAIVRIMKSRKTLDHYSLVMEVVDQLKARFMPSLKEIKRNLEGLIDRDYLERDSNDHQKYHYVA